LSGDGRHEDDHSPGVALEHRPSLGTGTQRGQHEVLIDDVAPILAVHVNERHRAAPLGQHADVVDRDVDGAELGNDVGHHALDLRVVAAVRDHRDRPATLGLDLGDHRRGVVGTYVVHRDRRTGTRQPTRNLAADPCA
jgi:hypothetical protein